MFVSQRRISPLTEICRLRCKSLIITGNTGSALIGNHAESPLFRQSGRVQIPGALIGIWTGSRRAARLSSAPCGAETRKYSPFLSRNITPCLNACTRTKSFFMARKQSRCKAILSGYPLLLKADGQKRMRMQLHFAAKRRAKRQKRSKSATFYCINI